ncbi:MAG: flagellar biosynthetic protein FliR [Sedimentisphaerales bacterium]|nr:flagellar biosynthetic protein FliR [Sedimentisphaerales bacterium]
MLETIQQLVQHAPVFILVLFRVAGLLVLAPVLGSARIPPTIRVLLAVILSAAIYPMVPAAAVVPASLAPLAMAIGSEMLIGITMGFCLYLMLTGVQIGADLVGYQMGLGMAHLVDPNTELDSTVLSEFYLLVATLIYVLMNGHIALVRSLADTFRTVPLMGGSIGLDVLDAMITVLTNAFVLGVRVAGPALTAIFLATLALGFISRTMPQLNILAAGFPIRITLGICLIVVSFGGIGILFEDSLVRVLQAIGGMFL